MQTCLVNLEKWLLLQERLIPLYKNHSGKSAILDQDTRWGSTYLMIRHIIDRKPYIDDLANPNVSLKEHKWNELTELEILLRYPFSVTKKLQRDDLTLSEFFLA